MFPQSVLIGLVVALVGYFLQQRSWRHNKREEVRHREFEACTKIIEDLARALDKRILGHVDKWRSQRRIDVMSMKPRKLSAVLS